MILSFVYITQGVQYGVFLLFELEKIESIVVLYKFVSRGLIAVLYLYKYI
jgi:hypothetical protein